MMLQTMIMLEFKGDPQMDQSIQGNFIAIAETKFLTANIFESGPMPTP